MDPQQRQSNRNQQTSTTAISAPATNSIVSEPRVFFQRRYKPTSFAAARCLSRNIGTNYVCTEKVSSQTEKGSKPTHSGFFRASHCFVKLNEWSLSWSCILLNLGRVRFHLDFLSTTVSLVPKSISARLVEFISIQLPALCCTDPYVVPIDPLRFQVVVVFLVTVSHKPSQPRHYRNGDAGDLGKLSATVS